MLDITTCRTANTKILQIGAVALRGFIAAIRPPISAECPVSQQQDERATWPFLNVLITQISHRIARVNAIR